MIYNLCRFSSEPAGGAVKRHEGRRDAVALHALAGAARVRPAADVRARYPQQAHQPGQRAATSAGQSLSVSHYITAIPGTTR